MRIKKKQSQKVTAKRPKRVRWDAEVFADGKWRKAKYLGFTFYWYSGSWPTFKVQGVREECSFTLKRNVRPLTDALKKELRGNLITAADLRREALEKVERERRRRLPPKPRTEKEKKFIKHMLKQFRAMTASRR